MQYAANGQQLTKVSSNPQAGQYTCASGSYGFNSADAGQQVLISYTYAAGSRGATVLLANQSMGYAPEFRALLYNTFHGKYFALELFNCTAGEISLPTKLEDFWIVDINFDACCDSTGNLGRIYADLA